MKAKQYFAISREELFELSKRLHPNHLTFTDINYFLASKTPIPIDKQDTGIKYLSDEFKTMETGLKRSLNNGQDKFHNTLQVDIIRFFKARLKVAKLIDKENSIPIDKNSITIAEGKVYFSDKRFKFYIDSGGENSMVIDCDDTNIKAKDILTDNKGKKVKLILEVE